MARKVLRRAENHAVDRRDRPCHHVRRQVASDTDREVVAFLGKLEETIADRPRDVKRGERDGRRALEHAARTRMQPLDQELRLFGLLHDARAVLVERGAELGEAQLPRC
jgi:hypothetical protein